MMARVRALLLCILLCFNVAGSFKSVRLAHLELRPSTSVLHASGRPASSRVKAAQGKAVGALKLARIMRDELTNIICGRDIKAKAYPEQGLLESCCIHNVDMSVGNSHAKVYIGLRGTIVQRMAVYVWLNKHVPQIRHSLSQRLRFMKRLPQIDFRLMDTDSSNWLSSALDEVSDFVSTQEQVDQEQELDFEEVGSGSEEEDDSSEGDEEDEYEDEDDEDESGEQEYEDEDEYLEEDEDEQEEEEVEEGVEEDEHDDEEEATDQSDDGDGDGDGADALGTAGVDRGSEQRTRRAQSTEQDVSPSASKTRRSQLGQRLQRHKSARSARDRFSGQGRHTKTMGLDDLG